MPTGHFEFTIPASEHFSQFKQKYIWLNFINKTSLLRYGDLTSSHIFLLSLLFNPQSPSWNICRRTLRNCQSLTAMPGEKVSGAHFYLSLRVEEVTWNVDILLCNQVITVIWYTAHSNSRPNCGHIFWHKELPWKKSKAVITIWPSD